MNKLPRFPVDDMTLEMVMYAIRNPEGPFSSLGALLDLLSEMNGSDPNSIEETIGDDIVVLSDCFYHQHDVIVSLVEEVQSLRQELKNRV